MPVLIDQLLSLRLCMSVGVRVSRNSSMIRPFAISQETKARFLGSAAA